MAKDSLRKQNQHPQKGTLHVTSYEINFKESISAVMLYNFFFAIHLFLKGYALVVLVCSNPENNFPDSSMGHRMLHSFETLK